MRSRLALVVVLALACAAPAAASNVVTPKMTAVASWAAGKPITVWCESELTHYGSGVFDQAIQECAARVLIYDALRRFYGVPFFTSRMRSVVGTALAYSLALPAEYQGGCDRL